jgi:hypothetical protein
MQGRQVGYRPVAYVGQAKDLRVRLRQHLVLRDSSATTGASVVSLNPDLVRAVEWWEHGRFEDGDAWVAAELVAFDVLDPALRSRGKPTAKAVAIYEDSGFREEFRSLFSNAASSSLTIETLPGLSARLQLLEDRLAAIETLLQSSRRKHR